VRKRLSLFLALLMAPLLVVCTAGQSSGAEATSYKIERTLSRRIRVSYVGQYEVTGVEPEEWRLVSPLAPGLPSQTGVKTTISPEGKAFREPGGEERLFVMSRERSTSTMRPLIITYEATLWTRRLVAGKPGIVDTLSDKEHKWYLADTPDLDFTHEHFQAWLDRHELRRTPSESEIDFGRRVFRVILGQYTTSEEEIKGQPVSEFVHLDKADCKVRSAVFAATMRANQIPARVLFGRLAHNKQPEPGGLIVGHARAEFFVEHVGWIPVDVNYALASRDPMSRFGEDPADMLVQNVDASLWAPGGEGTTVVYSLDPPRAEVKGKGAGKIRFQAKSWTVETIPISPQATAKEPLEYLPEIVKLGPETPETRTHTSMNVIRLEGQTLEVTVEYPDHKQQMHKYVFKGTTVEISKSLESLEDLPPEMLQNWQRRLPLLDRPIHPAGPDVPATVVAAVKAKLTRLDVEHVRLEVEYHDRSGKLQKATQEGTREEVSKWLESLPDFPPGDLTRWQRVLTLGARPLPAIPGRTPAPQARE
jgi:transglutaminase-like putative cysteine protease